MSEKNTTEVVVTPSATAGAHVEPSLEMPKPAVVNITQLDTNQSQHNETNSPTSDSPNSSMDQTRAQGGMYRNSTLDLEKGLCSNGNNANQGCGRIRWGKKDGRIRLREKEDRCFPLNKMSRKWRIVFKVTMVLLIVSIAVVVGVVISQQTGNRLTPSSR
ncbi:MAG: hypothetical protein M1834_006343 [Cirrosporium novae-zelandiae]|nr:MAG: hypothetical protein M1834_006343 [Cirrosporium novae-zelandiae]